MTNNLIIKPYEEDDVPLLEKWVYSGEYKDFFRDMLAMSRSQLKIYSYMKDGQAFVIWNKGTFSDDSITPVGFIVLYEMRAVPSNLKLAILIDKRFQEQGYCFDSMKIMCDYIFNQMHFKKVIIEVLESNSKLRSIVERGGFDIEATLKREANCDGKLVDVIRYALFHDDYDKKCQEGFYGR